MLCTVAAVKCFFFFFGGGGGGGAFYQTFQPSDISTRFVKDGSTLSLNPFFDPIPEIDIPQGDLYCLATNYRQTEFK